MQPPGGEFPNGATEKKKQKKKGREKNYQTVAYVVNLINVSWNTFRVGGLAYFPFIVRKSENCQQEKRRKGN